jgi:hypothetical protein
MPRIIGSIITDCADSNARTRQELRFASLFGVTPSFIGLGAKDPDIEAGGNLIDQLGTLNNMPVSAVTDVTPVILVNVAPRGDKIRKKWNNGTPFCYVRVNNTLIVSTYAGRTLSLLDQFGLADSVEVMDIPTVVAAAVAWGDLSRKQADHIMNTQFRSLEFLPLAAYWLTQGRNVPSEAHPIETDSDIRGRVWCIDSFGNAKTTLTESDVSFEEGKKMVLTDGSEATCHRRLADVPKDESALVVGSSGLDTGRFLELVVQWRDDGFHGSYSAASRHSLSVGSTVLK